MFVTELALFAIIIFLFLVLSMIWPPDSPWAPWWKTSPTVAKAAASLAHVKNGDVVYELGSGDGEFLLTLTKLYKIKAVGIEIDPIRYAHSRIRALLQRRDTVIFIKKNFFDVDISEATVVFVYLVPRALNNLIPKFKKELKPGSKIISFRYEMNFPLLEADKTHKLYVYEIPRIRDKKSYK